MHQLKKLILVFLLFGLAYPQPVGTQTDCLCDDIPLLGDIFSCQDVYDEQLCDAGFITAGRFCECTCGYCALNTTDPLVNTEQQDVLAKVKSGDLNVASPACTTSRQRCQQKCGGDIYSIVFDCDTNGEAQQCLCDGQKLDGLFRTFGLDAQSYGKQVIPSPSPVSFVTTFTQTSGPASATASASASSQLNSIRSSAKLQTIEDRCMLLVDDDILQGLIETVNMVRGDPMKYRDQYKCDASKFLANVSSPVRGDLVLDQKLNYASSNHSCWQAEFDNIDHTGKDGSSPGTRAKWQEYEWMLVGETLAYNYPLDDLLEVVLAWYCSPSHRDILASCFMVEAGVGVALNFKGEPYYTLMAACPKSDSSRCTCRQN
eukprot:TRINITY_DN5258_c0_g1_i1.p1 TRINITY_DN5258_c0_g1~~TRINITY_DN5258_c0_g1_i1.p1  ORF type:complete len:373 (-),score=30.75 TRINITY_DN5258_c0_g1_i1:110-1228(-)